LRLVGAGAALSLVPAYLSSLAARPSAAQTVSPEILSRDGQFPIGVWWPPPPAKTTPARYAEIVRAGFNFVIGGNGVTTTELHARALDAAAANGLRYVITDNILHNAIDGEVSPDRREAVSKRLERLLGEHGAHPALAGLNLYDEPKSRLFGVLGHAKRELGRLAPEELPYVNVWPSYASPRALGAPSYGEYLERYFATVGPPMLSFDHYPLLSKGVTSDYFLNWAQIRNFSLRFGVPSWGFIQSVGFSGSRIGLARRRRPTQAELFWQINVSLAYGAKGVQYFTYWTPTSDARIQFGNALLTRDGQLTLLYRYATNANRYLRVIGKELLALRSESVVHARTRRLPRGAKAFKADDYLRSVAGSPIILGTFKDPTTATERHLFVANHSSANRATSRLTLSGAVSEVHEVDGATGARVPVDLRGTRELRFSIEPGRARLYVLHTG
jgi:hypothetical protein